GSSWIPPGLSIWQFKSGRDHAPAKLKEEFGKPRVQEAVRQGGSYIVVIGEDLNDKKFEARRKALDACCLAAGIPQEQCRMLAATHMAQWASEHPPIWFLPYFSRPLFGDWMRWERLAADDRFQQDFTPDQA